VSPSQRMLRQLVLAGYHRFFRASSLLYPPVILYFTHWVPAGEVGRYLLVRALVAVLVVYLGWGRRRFPIELLRFIAIVFIASAMVGNIQLVHYGGPSLIGVLAHGGMILFGFLEVDAAWTVVMSGLLSLVWFFTIRATGGSGDVVAAGLGFSLAIAVFLVTTRGAALRRMVGLSVEQGQVNHELAAALEMVAGYNAELELRVAERRQELEQASARLTEAYAELQSSHQVQNQLQAEWLQARRLEMLGRFATGLSHSFSNTVTSIWLGLSQLENCDEAFSSASGLADIEMACEKLTSICRRLLMASGSHIVVDRRFEVNQQVRDSLTLLKRAVPNPLELKTNSDQVYAFGDPALLDQILMNLIINAASASRPGQPIQIEVDDLEGCNVAVQDYGTGIDPQVLERIFEPFYTTKSDGQGHGLGLAIVTGAVERLYGRCSVSSQPGEGTQFIVHLPPANESAQDVVDTRPAPAATSIASLRICLVEDQDALRKLLTNFLKKQGHQVSAYASAEEVSQAADQFDLVVTDISLPGRNGVDFAQELVGQNPELRVVFMSGYPFEAENVSLDSRRWIFLPKPFRLSEFGQQFAAVWAVD
jgi:signal transduction histidine kinase